MQLDLIHQSRLENKTSTNQHKKTVSILYETVFYIIILMIFIYIEIIFCVLYPPITSFYLHLFSLENQALSKNLVTNHLHFLTFFSITIFIKLYFYKIPIPFYITRNKTKQNKTKQNKTKQNKTKQNKTKQNKTKQNKTKQNKTKQNKTKQNKTKQKKSTERLIFYLLL